MANGKSEINAVKITEIKEDIKEIKEEQKYTREKIEKLLPLPKQVDELNNYIIVHLQEERKYIDDNFHQLYDRDISMMEKITRLSTKCKVLFSIISVIGVGVAGSLISAFF